MIKILTQNNETTPKECTVTLNDGTNWIQVDFNC